MFALLQVGVQLDCSLVAVLAGATALRDLEIQLPVCGPALSMCCVLSQITRLDIDSVKAPFTEADVNAAICGSLKGLRVKRVKTRPGCKHAYLHNQVATCACAIAGPDTLLRELTCSSAMQSQMEMPMPTHLPAVFQLP